MKKYLYKIFVLLSCFILIGLALIFPYVAIYGFVYIIAMAGYKILNTKNK